MIFLIYTLSIYYYVSPVKDMFWCKKGFGNTNYLHLLYNLKGLYSFVKSFIEDISLNGFLYYLII